MNQFHQFIDQIQADIAAAWDDDIIPTLCEYIKIPNKSPDFDAHWQENGYMQLAMTLLHNWAQHQNITGMATEVIQLPNRTPLMFIEIDGQKENTILLYGHMDKQPEMHGWHENKGPWVPVIEDQKLYGRGGADDGYALFSCLNAIGLLQKYNIPHARCVIIIEGCEESGSYDLKPYLERLQDRIGTPELVICLDSTAGNYQQLWSTTSLRGMISGHLSISVLNEGIHSGMGSGVVPSIEMILRQLLDRLENSATGQIHLPELTTEIPTQRINEAKIAASMLDQHFISAYPLSGNTQPLSSDIAELILNRTWRPQLSITGTSGYPDLQHAGNVTIPTATFKLSIRIPPSITAATANGAVKALLEKDPPFGATITFTPTERASGWHAPPLAHWLRTACDQASQQFFNKNAAYMGEGGLIPFMGMLGRQFPNAQFLITGVLGPHSNAHGPNEFLHIPTVKKITGCVASVIAAHYQHATLPANCVH